MNTLKRVEANEKAAYEAEKAEAEKIKAELEKDSTMLTSSQRLVTILVCSVQSQARRLLKALKSNTVSRLTSVS